MRDHEAGVEARVGRQEWGKHAGERVGHLLDAAFGDAAERGDGYGDLIGGHGQRLAVKVSSAHNVSLAVCFHKYQRVIGRTVQFHHGHFARLYQRIADRAVDLRRAAEAVSVLHPGVFVGCAVGFANLAAFVEVREIARGFSGPGVGTGMHDACVERPRAAA